MRTLSFSSGPHMVSEKPLVSSILFASYEYPLEIQTDKLMIINIGQHREGKTHRKTVNIFTSGKYET